MADSHHVLLVDDDVVYVQLKEHPDISVAVYGDGLVEIRDATDEVIVEDLGRGGASVIHNSRAENS